MCVLKLRTQFIRFLVSFFEHKEDDLNMLAEKLFNGKCPYTDQPCDDWCCEKCEVEQEEKKSLELYLAELKEEK